MNQISFTVPPALTAGASNFREVGSIITCYEKNADKLNDASGLYELQPHIPVLTSSS